MSLQILQALHALLGQHIQQAQQGQLGNNSPQAQLYASHPTDPRVIHADPSQFGYGPDNSGARLAVGHPANYGRVPANLLVGLSNLQQINQGGNFNPGFTPLQNSGFGSVGSPQIRAFNSPQAPQLNPQNVRALY